MNITPRHLISGLTATGIAILTVIAGGIDRVQAATINTLYNTGVDATGVALADGTVGDPHYQLISVPGSSTTDIRTRTSAGGYPFVSSLDNTISSWIGPNNANSLISPPGDYTYRTTFSLAGLLANTASITGNWSTDNVGLKILLNGVDTGVSANSVYGSSSTFTISSGFGSGINTLDFVVNNVLDGGTTLGPTALRVEMSGSADSAASVPEPSALLGTAIAFSSIAILKRKTTKTESNSTVKSI
jgi:hypothetical protein